MKKVRHFFYGGENFKQEFRKQARFLIIVTLAFTIAFSWRQTVFDAVQTAVQKVLHTQGLPSSFLTSTAITLISLGFIYLTSHALKERKE